MCCKAGVNFNSKGLSRVQSGYYVISYGFYLTKLHIRRVKIFLVGYMGSGKSTVGKKLAHRMSLPYFDLDQEIEKAEGLSVSDIFARGGEAAFRGIESKILKNIIHTQDAFVLSTGGGTPCFYDNMEVMKATGLTVYLQLDVKSLAFRLGNAQEQRPMLAGLYGESLEKFIRQHLEERSAFYEEAHIKVHALAMNAIKLESLQKQLENYSR